MIFLSYAEADRARASVIAEWLRARGHEVFRWEDPERRGKRFIRQIEEAINRSDAFLALISPSFLTSDWCRRETELALQREQDLQARDPELGFVHVLKIMETPNSGAGFLRSYDWLDLTETANGEAALRELAGRLTQAARPGSFGPTSFSPAGPDPVSSAFRNREDELERVLRGLTNPAGPHFWLVIAPPQLGKTWFLARARADVMASAAWATTLVDLRAQPELRGDAAGLLASLFELPSVTLDREALRLVAREVSRVGKPRLCVLDSAELLTRETAVSLRACLGQIYRFIQAAGNPGVRLAVLVASRREDEWRGVTPYPRLSSLALTEFSADVVQQALRDLARDMNERNFSDEDYRKNALRAHRMTEGLPALLMRCLEWIRDEEWLEPDRMGTPDLFDTLSDPYIHQDLLARDSLLPGQSRHAGEAGQPDRSLHALEQTFRILAPYRFFTQAHIRHRLESDASFRAALDDRQWSMEELWKAISGTALLARPLSEPWQQIYGAIRRVLYRHYYKSDEEQAQAHSEARKFVETWAEAQSGKEQVIGLVESLWHEATVLRLREPAEMTPRLSESARTLSRNLRASSAYTLDELRGYASERMRSDEELEETVSNIDGLFTRLIDIVATPL